MERRDSYKGFILHTEKLWDNLHLLRKLDTTFYFDLTIFLQCYPGAHHQFVGNLQRFGESEEEYFRAIELNKGYSTAYSNLGQLYLLMQRWDEAEEVLTKAISLNADEFHAHESLAKLFMLKGESERSEYHWKRSYLINPESGILLNLAYSLIQQQKLDEALQELNRALPQEEENPRLYSLLGIIHFATYDFGSAITCFKRSLGLEPEDAEVRHNLAMAYLKTGQTMDAIIELRRILLLAPSHTDARNNLAVIELSAGEAESALEHFTITLEQEPQNPKALYYTGVLMLQRGDVKLAKRMLLQTIESNHDDYKQKAVELLKSISEVIP